MQILRIGPFTIPIVAIVAAAILFIAYLSATIPIGKDKDKRRILTDILLSPLVPFLLAWKLSLLITDGRDVLKNPRMLLFSSGGFWNLTIAVLVAGIWMWAAWFRRTRTQKVNRGLLRYLTVVLVLGMLSWITLSTLSNRSTEIVHTLPSFELETAEGKQWTLESAHQNGPIVLNFWASWCPPCRSEMPMLADISQDPRFSDTEFYAVNARYSEAQPDSGVNWLNDEQISIPLLFDTSGEASKRLSIVALPTTFILDRYGNVVALRTGAIERSWLSSGIRKARKSTGSDS